MQFLTLHLLKRGNPCPIVIAGKRKFSAVNCTACSRGRGKNIKKISAKLSQVSADFASS
jgi:hypothetical protein